MNTFTQLNNPVLHFGAGTASKIPDLIGRDGPVLILTGRHLSESAFLNRTVQILRERGHEVRRECVSGEPSPDVVDELSEAARGVVCIAAIGGGSVIDAGKAAAAMALHDGRVTDYLEGVGTKNPQERTLPLIAVPTTAGTGSEATSNAVITQRGTVSFKKSLRHPAFVPSCAVVDPQLAEGCAPQITEACAMDAFCQLLESFISTKASPLTDALARTGIAAFDRGSRLFTDGRYGTADEVGLRAELALAAWCSGVTLMNAGLGVVHGMAGPLGAVCDIPHGQACAILAAPLLRRLTVKLQSEEQTEILNRMNWAGAVLNRGANADAQPKDAERLTDWLEKQADSLPRLSSFGLSDPEAVARDSSDKNSPAALSAAERCDALGKVM